jgi:1-acyl-sn-glycerol-3-phosphate acyltransferase
LTTTDDHVPHPPTTERDTTDINSQQIGELVPRRGNLFTRWLSATALRLAGWRAMGKLPNAPKFIIIGAPHTSNWDFVLVMLASIKLNVRISWMGKQSLFRGVQGKVLRWLGGIPIDRNAAGGVVRENVRAFDRAKQLVLCITPEGTRSDAEEWKSGFYRIAQEAGVPILLAAFDFRNRVVWLGPTLEISGDYAADLAHIQDHYRGIRGRHTV